MHITFNELRKIKDSLPNGTMKKISKDLGVSVETVRNYFGGRNFKKGDAVGLHIEPGPDGGLVQIDDPKILEMAKSILAETKPQTASAGE